MAIRLKKSTASQEIPLGPFVDATDGFTAETALTIANTDIKVWKNGATSLADKNSGGATHMALGVYSIVLDATDTDTLGPLVITVGVAGARPIRVECEVMAAAVFDTLSDTNRVLGGIVAGALGNVAALVHAGSTTTAVIVNLDPAVAGVLGFNMDICNVANALKGKILTVSCATTNNPNTQMQTARIVSNTAKSGNLATLTVEPPLEGVAPGDILTIAPGISAGITSAGHAKASVEALQGVTQAAEALRKMAMASAFGALGSGSTTTVLQVASMTPAPTVANQLKGRVVLFVDDAASEAAMKIQGGRILSNTTATITLEAPLTQAPASGNVFMVV